MKTFTYRHLALPVLFLTLSLCPVLYGSPESLLTAVVTFNDGHAQEFDVPTGKELSLNTCAGDVEFPYSSIATIKVSDSTGPAMVTLSSGEYWMGTTTGDLLKRIGQKRITSVAIEHGAARRIAFANESAETGATVGFMKLLLEDGSHAMVNPSEVLLEVESRYGDLNIPLGSLRALKFMKSADPGSPRIILVRFPSGNVEVLKLRSHRNYMRLTDHHNNDLKVVHSDIKGILSLADVSEVISSTAAIDAPNVYNVTWRNGESQAGYLPLTVWRLKTAAGAVILPSPMVSSIKRTPDSEEHVEVHSIYGDILPGKLSPASIRIQSESENGYTDIDADDIDAITTTSLTLPIPDSALVWYLKSGLAIVGRFAADETSLLTDEEIEILPGSIRSLVATTGNRFEVTLKQEATPKMCRATARKLKVLLLANGMTLSIPWTEVYRIEAQPRVTESFLADMLAQQREPPQQDDYEETVSIRSGERKPVPRAADSVAMPPMAAPEKANEIQDSLEAEDRSLRLSSALGALELQPEDVASVAITKSPSRACVTTTCGDRFLVATPSRRWLSKLQDLEDYELPEDERVTIQMHARDQGTFPADYVTCRLLSGDIVHGTIPEQELRLGKHKSRPRSIDILTENLRHMSRNEDGDLTFQLNQGQNIVGTPKQRTLEIHLFITDTTVKLPFKQIEVLAVAGRRLPPTTVFAPGMSSDLLDEVLITAGSFTRGSLGGMDDEQPAHTVYVGAFMMDSSEVTRAQFAAFIRATAYETVAEQSGGPTSWRSPGFTQSMDDPVVCVTWSDAAAYCNWRSEQLDLPMCYTFEDNDRIQSDRTAMGYRLPTEAEWEFAARCRSNEPNLPWASDLDATQQANFRQQDGASGDGWEWTNPVLAFPANTLGLYGLGGNVWEWCEDWYYNRAYAALQSRGNNNPCFGPTDAANLTRRVMRGGSFRNGLDLLRCASRGNGLPYAFSNHVGFRCVRNAE
jgi:formylglycine-generating enzyme